MCAGDLCGYQSRRSAKSQILESRRPERKRDLEALPANSPGSCGSESIGVQEILSVPPTLEVPWALSHPRLAKKAAWVLCTGPSPQSSVHGNLEKLQRSTAIPPQKKCTHPNLLGQDPTDHQGGSRPAISIRDHPPRLPAQLSGLSTYRLWKQRIASGLSWRSAGDRVARRWAQRAAHNPLLPRGSRTVGAAAGPGRVGAHSELCALPALSSRLSARKARPPPTSPAGPRATRQWLECGAVPEPSLQSFCLNSSRVARVFDFSAFGTARGTCPTSLQAWVPPQLGGGGLRGLGGDWPGSPARLAPGSPAPGDAVSGSRAAFKKLNTIFGNPPVGILPPHTRHNTHSPPLLHSFLPRFLLLPLLPPTFQPIILPLQEKGVGEEKTKCLFLCPNLWALFGPALSDRPEPGS